jgi:hypothetical protein
MRFLVMVKATKEWEGELPTAEMGAFNETLVRDGRMLAAEGLQPGSKGARISCASPRPVVTDGPFPETKELAAGFRILRARRTDRDPSDFRARRLCGYQAMKFVSIFKLDPSAMTRPPDEATMNRLGAGACELHEVSETPNTRP